jgi:tetratricopeptide (TPR) repeat protein
VSLTSYQSWDEVARWFDGLVTVPVSVSPAVRAKATELTKGLNDRAKKIDAIYDYVSSEVRYVSLSFGLGRYAPHPPDDVLRNQYGDCKDKAGLLAALLRAIDVESSFVLLHTNQSIDESLPSPLAFDHVITVIPAGAYPDGWLWMDSTAEVAPPGMLSPEIRGKVGLLIGSAPAGSRLVRTPADPPEAAVDRLAFEGKVNAIGVLIGRGTFTFTGDSALATRSLVRSLPPAEIDKFAATLAAAHGIPGEVSGFVASNASNTREPLVVMFQIRSADYLNWAATKSELKAFPTVTFPFADPVDRVGRNRLDFGSPKAVELHTSIELPDGYAIQPPVAVTISRAGFDYSSKYAVTGRQLTADRLMNVKVRELPAAQFPEYTALVGAVQGDFGQAFGILGKVTATPAIPSDATATELYGAAFNAFEAKNYEAAAQLWKRNTEVDATMGSAWVSLGLSYEKLKRFEEAAAAIRHQIALDPYDKRAYADLGRALSADGKLEEAATAFARHVELAPVDGDVLKELGTTYLGLQRYAEAVSPLERAAAIRKDDVWLLLDLGTAQLHAKQSDAALKTYDRATALSSTPAVLTRIAWDLAEAGQQIDHAAELSARADRDITELTGKLNLNAVRNADLDLMSRLAWAWDAAGWVHHLKGNTAQAEAYTEAAWLLGGEPDTAFHLAQIYEQTDDHRAEALGMYLTAEALSERPTESMRAAVLRLAGSGDRKALVDGAKRATDIERMVQLKAARASGVTGHANFLVMLGDDTIATDVRFLDGDDAMRALAPSLLEPGYPVSVPGHSAVRLLIGVSVKCLPGGTCVGIVAPARKVRLTD